MRANRRWPGSAEASSRGKLAMTSGPLGRASAQWRPGHPTGAVLCEATERRTVNADDATRNINVVMNNLVRRTGLMVTVTCLWLTTLLREPTPRRSWRRNYRSKLWTSGGILAKAAGRQQIVDKTYMHWPKRLTGSSIHIGQEGPREIWREACGMVISATTLESRTILAHCSVAPPRGPRVG